MATPRCNCEHSSHFEDGAAHRFQQVDAGDTSAVHVGPICDQCAATHMSGFTQQIVESTESDTLLAWSMDAGLLGGALEGLRAELVTAGQDLEESLLVLLRSRLERAIVTIDGTLAKTQRYGKV